MIDIRNSDFFSPAKKFRQLSILQAVVNESHLSQQEIARTANLSGAMVNEYVRILREQGLIDVVDKNKRDKLYHLTDVGKKNLTELLMLCSAEIVQLYGQAKYEIISRLTEYFTTRETCKTVLFGGAETAEVVISALEQFPQVVLSTVVDNDSAKWGEKIGNHIIQPPDLLHKITFDSLIISSFARQEEIYESVSWLKKSGVKIIKLTSL